MSLSDEYRDALRDCLHGAGERALARAYELGRRAAGSGIGIVELEMMHDRALRELDAGPPEVAAQFLAESLSPFEMTHRGFQEAVQRLEVANDALARSNAELASANRELEAFSYSVSHDLRAPLRTINAFTQALAEDIAHQLDHTSRDHLRRVLAATARMSDLIDALLELSRVSRSPIDRERTDVSGLAAAAAEELQKREPGRHVEITVAQGLEADADPRLVRILLDNLLGNAWKFTSHKPIARIELGSSEDGVFYVRDDGAGFDMAHVDRLFTPFQRLHPTS